MASNPSALRARRTIPTSEQGLTLIEMIVVLAIIAIIAGLIVVNVINRPDQARGTTTQVDMRNIASALKIYRLDNGDYPSTAQGLAALVTKPTGEPVARNWNSGGYLDAVPIDPWGHPYIYRSPGEGGTGFDLVSNGKDGKPGGEGLDADVKVSAR
ncbi:type II secretion system major pseudopilin GspG [Sphingomonas sp. MMS24-J13]|uniref:type II secretion system major pseudopilin GspG n=1 Tax=Sphingomonas sp. MMS24-J13 TaxID=3238686 RepID=UPI00384CB25D